LTYSENNHSEENLSFFNERLLWRNEIKTGIIHRKVIETQVITTKRVLKNAYTIRLEDIIDIVITNKKRISNYQSTGYRSRHAFNSFGTTQSRSKTIGDVIFFHKNGETDFRQIEDPQSIMRIVKAAKKMVLTEIKEKQKVGKIQNKKSILCKNCGNNNPLSSAFCNKCGTQINSSVTPATTANKLENNNIELQNQIFDAYENLSEGIRIQYPSDWIVLDEQQERPKIVDFLSPLEDPSDNYREPFSILKFIYDFVFSIDDFVKNEINNLNKDNNVTIIKLEQITLLSRQAWKVIFKKDDIVFYQIFTLEQNISGKGMTLFGLGSAIKADKYEKFLPIIDKMINTFEIL